MNMIYDIVIIGAGPAGMTAALYGARAGKKVLLIEAVVPGGQIVNAKLVRNYPGIVEISGADFSKNLLEQVKKAGAEIEYEQVVELIDGETKTVKTEDDEHQARAVIIATGLSYGKLGLPREEELTGKGVSYCATCDGNFFKGKDVAVVGGGNTALQDALYLSDLANKVYLIHRRDEFRGDKALVDQLRKIENVEFVMNSNVVELEGDGEVSGVVVKDKDGGGSRLAVSAVFMAVGNVPQNEAFRGLIELDENGYVVSSDGVHTNVAGFYVAGDARVKDLRQLTTAVSDGSIAATVAINELKTE